MPRLRRMEYDHRAKSRARVEGCAGAAHAVRRQKSLPDQRTDADAGASLSQGMAELDRVLGGGAVKGSLVLIGGAPGIGKSTLMLQICGQLCSFARVLYVSGEESERQLKLRANRLNVTSSELLVLSETGIDAVLQAVDEEKPDILIVDSIQTMFDERQDATPGSISQVKACTMSLMQVAKSQNITVFVIGHVNKDGAIAGPKVLEHMWTASCILKATRTRPIAFFGRRKTASARRMR